MNVLYSKYQDVGGATTDTKQWEQSQDKKAKSAYRTMDEIELKQNKQYNLLIDNGINFVKQNVMKGLKKKEIENKMKQQ